MTLATLYNIPNDENSLAEFSFTNADEHTKIARAVLTNYAVTLPLFVLDPVPLFDMGAWLYQHQQAHNQQNSVLGIAGNDLTDVDFTSPDQIANWIQLHVAEHIQAANILRLT